MRLFQFERIINKSWLASSKMIEGHGTLEQVIDQIKNRYTEIFNGLMGANEGYVRAADSRLSYECTQPDIIITSLSLRQKDNGMIGSRIKRNFEQAMKSQFPKCYRLLSFIYLASSQINKGIEIAMESKSVAEERRDEPLFQHSNTDIEDFILENATELSENFQKSAQLYKPVTESMNRDISLLTRHWTLDLPNEEGREIVPFLH